MGFNANSNFLYLILNATVVVKVVLLILFFMSIISWTIIIYKTILFLKFKTQIKNDVQLLKNSSTLSSAIKILATRKNSFIYSVSFNVLEEFKKIRKLSHPKKEKIASEAMDTIINNNISDKLNDLAYTLSFLATCTNSAPFIGLFGTVWGIMHSFHNIGIQKSAGLATVAPGIAEALIATAFGLAVAVPASIAYNTFLGSLDNIENYLNSYKAVFTTMVKREINIFFENTQSDK